MPICNQTKIVVFDLDETLGYFSKFAKIWKLLNQRAKLDQTDFDTLLDLYPEFIRPHMLTILKKIKQYKMKDIYTKVMIYTNNQISQNWVYYIKSYFETKLKYNLFDQVICAFKINGKVIELGRTTHNKTFSELLNCSKIKIPRQSQICFIDNTYYPKMDVVDVVYYIKVSPYIYDLPNPIIIQRLLSSSYKSIVNPDKITFNYIVKSNKDYEMDKIITKKIMFGLEDFFK
jgi:hypothetical protein